MSSHEPPLITPGSPEQRAMEDAISAQLAEAESDAVVDILAAAPTAEKLHDVIDNAFGFAEAMTQKYRHPATPSVACKKGCYWCCFQSVPVTAPEAFRVARFLRKQPNAESTNTIERLRRLDVQTRGKSPTARALKRLPCAFLKEGQCSIYSARPLACAEFTSFNVEDCKRGQREGFSTSSIVHEKARMIVYYAVEKGLAHGLKSALPNADTARLELTAAVLGALDAIEPEESWIDGGSLFSDAHLVGR